MTPGFLGPDGIHLSQWGKSIFAHKLTGLFERALNYVWREKGVNSNLLVISYSMTMMFEGLCIVWAFALLHNVLSTRECI